MADDSTKAAAERSCYSVEQQLLREASLARLAKKTTRTRAQSTRDWIPGHVSLANTTGHRREAISNLACERSEMSWPEDITNSSWAMPRPEPIWPIRYTRFRRTSVGGAAAGRDSSATISS